MSEDPKETESNTSELPQNMRYFLYFELIAIILFVPFMLVQVYLTMDYFLYIFAEVDLYHYYLVTEEICSKSYPSDMFPLDESKFVWSYINEYYFI